MRSTFDSLIRAIVINMTILWTILLCAECVARGDELHILEPSRMSLEGYKIANNRDEYLQINDKGSTKYGESSEHWVYGAAAKFDFSLLKYGEYGLYWNNNVHMAATNVAVRHVGWEFEWGANVSKHLDLFYYHHSQHIMDLERNPRRYPLVNQYGVRFILIEGGRK